MYRTKIVIIFTILLFSFVSKGQQQDGSVFERRISLNQQDQTLEFILDQISWQAGVYFSYDASILNSEKKYSVEAQSKSLFSILNLLLNPKEFQLNERGNQIIITKQTRETPAKQLENDSIQIPYYFLSGKLVEDKKGRPVKYASVSVFGKPVGTISNTDGEFLLKLHPDDIRDTVVISSMGYAQIIIPAYKLLDEDLFILKPVSIRIKEVQVKAITPEHLLENIRENIQQNYSRHSKVMTSFYRETVKQDDNYINVSEAIIEVLKSPYFYAGRGDLVRVVKGRKNPDVQPFKWLNFKLQGGPFTITKLDVIKNLENFIDKEYEQLYNYQISKVIWYNEHPVYVVKFHPNSSSFFPLFEGEMYIHRETFALVHANFKLTKTGLKKAKSILIKKKPRNVKAHPSFVQYSVSYQHYQGKWQLQTAQASVKFKVRSKRDKINSEFHSVSDLLITNIQSTDLKRFKKEDKFRFNDIFVEELGAYDQIYWENYNIIKPTEDLRKAFKKTILH